VEIELITAGIMSAVLNLNEDGIFLINVPSEMGGAIDYTMAKKKIKTVLGWF
jgi:hypothetical protein